MQVVLEQKIREKLGLSLIDAEKNAQILINAFDPHLQIIFWNKKCENYFGINKDSVLGRNLGDVVPYTVKSDKINTLYRALQGEEIIIEREKYERRHAFYRQLVTPLIKEGTIVGVLNIVWDI